VQSPGATRVCCPGQFQGNLVGKVVFGRHYGKDEATRLPHVGVNDILDELNVRSGLVFRLGVNEPGKVDDGEMRMVRHGDPKPVSCHICKRSIQRADNMPAHIKRMKAPELYGQGGAWPASAWRFLDL